MPGKLKEYVRDGKSRIFLFATTDSKTNQRIKDLEGIVNSVYIDEKNFPARAYYPIAEIVVLTIAHYFNSIVDESKLLRSFKIDEKDFALTAINIESIRMDGASLIFTLLPHAREHETKELVQRYAAILPFLEAA